VLAKLTCSSEVPIRNIQTSSCQLSGSFVDCLYLQAPLVQVLRAGSFVRKDLENMKKAPEIGEVQPHKESIIALQDDQLTIAVSHKRS